MRLKLLSWNIWYDGFFDEISRFLAAAEADVIALQEVVPDDPSRPTIEFLTKLGYAHVVAPVMKIKDGRTMANAVFSKLPILSNKVHVLSETDSRNAVRADIQAGGKILHVFSTHLLHPHLKPSDTQLLQAENLLKIFPKELGVVMGDMNATPDSAAIQKLKHALNDADPASTPTWSLYPEGCHICNPQALDIRFDYIFTSSDIKLDSFRVENSKGSDHLPISAIIEI